MIVYAAGLLFDDEGKRVALVHKNRGPERLVGKWGAIGGKVEMGTETEAEAMVREFKEETGCIVVGWRPFLVLRGDDWAVHFFKEHDTDALEHVRTMETEQVRWWRLDKMPDPIVPNLNWIIPMALGHMNDQVQLYEVVEKEPLAKVARVESE